MKYSKYCELNGLWADGENKDFWLASVVGQFIAKGMYESFGDRKEGTEK